MQLIKIERGKSRMTNYYMTANLFCGKAHIYTTLFDSFLKNCHKIPFRCLLVHHILRLAQGKKKVEVTRFRHWVLGGCQNIAGF